MRWVLYLVALMTFLAGLTFFLQGINVLPGSYMTGDPQWAVNGGVMMALALGLALYAHRLK